MNQQRRSNEGILSALNEALRGESSRLADVLSLLIEVEERGLHLELAYSSIFTFCREHLHFSGDETYRRVTAAHLGRRFPQILEALRTRRVLLTSVVMLKNLFTTTNVDELLAAAEGKTVRQMEEVIARFAPKPDVKSSIRQMPQPKAQPQPHGPQPKVPPQLHPARPEAPSSPLTPPLPLMSAGPPGPLLMSAEPSGPLTTARSPSSVSPLEAPTAAVVGTTRGETSTGENRALLSSITAAGPSVIAQLESSASAPRTPPSIPVSRQFSPLSETRHKVQFAASSALREKLERAQSLMRHRNLDGDLAVVVERALDLLIATIEKQKFATTKRPQRPKLPAERRSASRAQAEATPASAAPPAAAPPAPLASAPPAPADPTSDQVVRDDAMKFPAPRRRVAIPAAAKRAVAERDQRQCAFIGMTGKRWLGPSAGRPQVGTRRVPGPLGLLHGPDVPL